MIKGKTIFKKVLTLCYDQLLNIQGNFFPFQLRLLLISKEKKRGGGNKLV